MTRPTGAATWSSIFPPELHDRLVRLARDRGTSLGKLVREACEAQYGRLSTGRRLEAVRELGALALPVASPGEMKREAVTSAERLLP